MRPVLDTCIKISSDSIIKFEEKRSIIRFHNSGHQPYKLVQVDGCALTDGVKCDKMLCSTDEREERYVELKGSDISHAINQLKETIRRLGEHNDNRHAYIVCSKVLPQLSTKIQKAKKDFLGRYNSSLVVKVSPLDVKL